MDKDDSRERLTDVLKELSELSYVKRLIRGGSGSGSCSSSSSGIDDDDTNKEIALVFFEYTGDGCSVPKDVISVRFNEGLQKIGSNAFYNRSSLESITTPSTVTEIGIHAFYGCINLREIAFNDGLQKIGMWAFGNCSTLESITLPSTLVEIGISAFYGCNNLREVTFNDGLQNIGNGAFYTSLDVIEGMG